MSACSTPSEPARSGHVKSHRGNASGGFLHGAEDWRVPPSALFQTGSNLRASVGGSLLLASQGRGGQPEVWLNSFADFLC
jgi:hypothetical protein